MVKIEIDGQPLKLYPNQKIRLKMRNQIMYDDVLPKYYTYPFTIPLDEGTNSYLLNYPQSWQNKIKLSNSKIDCRVSLFGDNNPRNAVLNVRNVTSNRAECDLIVDKNVDDVGDKKLSELDMGSYVLGDGDYYCSKKIALYLRTLPTDSEIDVTLKVNGVDWNFTINNTPTNNLAGFKNGCNAVLPGLVSTMNSSQTAYTVSYSFNDDDTWAELTFTSLIPGLPGIIDLDNLSQQVTIPNDTADGHWYWYVLEEYNWIQSHLAEVIGGIIGTYAGDKPIVFPVVENIAYIDDPDNYKGWQNSFYLDFLVNKNSISFITPMPFFVYVMKKVFNALGFDAYGSFLEDTDVQKFILYSNVACDFWHKIYGDITEDSWDSYEIAAYESEREINIHNNVVNIAKYTPDVTVKEFLTEFKKMFNLKYDYNYANNTVDVYIAQTKTTGLIQQAQDYTNLIVNKWQLQNPSTTNDTLKLFKFSDDSSDNKPKQMGVLDYQKPYIVDANAKKEIIPKISSICEELVDKFLIAPAVQIEGAYKNGGTACDIKLLQYLGAYDNELLDPDTPAWAQVRASVYLVGYVANVFALNLDSYVGFSDYSSNWSLRWDTDKGFYNQCWKLYAAILNDGVQLKIAMTFDTATLLEIEKNPYMRLENSIAVWKDIDVELGSDTLPPAEMLAQLL